MTLRLPSVLSPADLPFAELLAARLDGELFRIDDGFAPVDEVEQPHHRAAALRAGLSDRLIAEQLSAAWIWGAVGRPPRRHQLCVATGARVGHAHPPSMAVREVVIEPQELVLIGGLLVTAPLRTAVDLARFSRDFDSETVRRLMRIGDFDLADCLGDLERRRNLPNKRLARLRLTSIRR